MQRGAPVAREGHKSLCFGRGGLENKWYSVSVMCVWVCVCDPISLPKCVCAHAVRLPRGPR